MSDEPQIERSDPGTWMGAAQNLQASLGSRRAIQERRDAIEQHFLALAGRAAQERQDAVRRKMEQWLQMLRHPQEAPTNASPPPDPDGQSGTWVGYGGSFDRCDPAVEERQEAYEREQDAVEYELFAQEGEQQTERADPDGPLVPLPKREPPPRVVSAPQHDFIAALYRPWEPLA